MVLSGAFRTSTQKKPSAKVSCGTWLTGRRISREGRQSRRLVRPESASSAGRHCRSPTRASQPPHHFLHPLLADVGVNLGGRNALVAEQRLDVHQLGPGVEPVGGVSMAQPKVAGAGGRCPSRFLLSFTPANGFLLAFMPKAAKVPLVPARAGKKSPPLPIAVPIGHPFSSVQHFGGLLSIHRLSAPPAGRGSGPGMPLEPRTAREIREITDASRISFDSHLGLQALRVTSNPE